MRVLEVYGSHALSLVWKVALRYHIATTMESIIFWFLRVCIVAIAKQSMLVIYLCIYLFLHNACATKPSTLMIYALFTQEYIIYPIYFFTILNEGKLELTKGNLGKPTHTLLACWMPKPLPPRNQCTGWFAPTREGRGVGLFCSWFLQVKDKWNWMKGT